MSLPQQFRPKRQTQAPVRFRGSSETPLDPDHSASRQQQLGSKQQQRKGSTSAAVGESDSDYQSGDEQAAESSGSGSDEDQEPSSKAQARSSRRAVRVVRDTQGRAAAVARKRPHSIARCVCCRFVALSYCRSCCVCLGGESHLWRRLQHVLHVLAPLLARVCVLCVCVGCTVKTPDSGGP
jgi:hypothetical protein